MTGTVPEVNHSRGASAPPQYDPTPPAGTPPVPPLDGNELLMRSR